MNESRELPLVDRRVTRVLVDFSFCLQFYLHDQQDTIELRINSPFILIHNSDRILITPEKPSTVAPALSLLNKDVSSARVQPNEVLEIVFSDDLVVYSDPDPKFEAWELAGPGNFKIVSQPGGKLALWS